MPLAGQVEDEAGADLPVPARHDDHLGEGDLALVVGHHPGGVVLQSELVETVLVQLLGDGHPGAGRVLELLVAGGRGKMGLEVALEVTAGKA